MTHRSIVGCRYRYILLGVGTMFASVTLLFSSRADMQPATLWRSARKASAYYQY